MQGGGGGLEGSPPPLWIQKLFFFGGGRGVRGVTLPLWIWRFFGLSFWLACLLVREVGDV